MLTYKELFVIEMLHNQTYVLSTPTHLTQDAFIIAQACEGFVAVDKCLRKDTTNLIVNPCYASKEVIANLKTKLTEGLTLRSLPDSFKE